MYNQQEIAERIRMQVKLRNGKVGDMLKDCGTNINALSEFKKGKQMSCISFARIADYLDCSVDYLLGRSEKIPTPKSGGELDEIEREIMERVRRMNPEQKATFLAFLRITVAKNQNMPVSVPGLIAEEAPQ